jgi:NAD+ synthase (glutamine-hydrolysing)
MAMNPELVSVLNDIRKERAFDPKDWIEKKCALFNEYMTKNGLKACVVNVSGGIDSAVTLGLAVHSSKMAGSPIKKVVGICQPIHSTEKIWKRGLEAIKAFEADGITIDGTQVFDQLSKLVEDGMSSVGVTPSSEERRVFARGQLKSYLRTPTAFFAAQTLSASGLPAIVLGTGNKDEDGYLCYFCKAGDGVCDVQLINDLHKQEVFAVAKELGAPESIQVAPPSADLWEGQTDENELGFSYDFVELWTTYLSWPQDRRDQLLSKLGPDARKEFEETGAKAARIHNANKHKLNFPFNINIL